MLVVGRLRGIAQGQTPASGAVGPGRQGKARRVWEGMMEGTGEASPRMLVVGILGSVAQEQTPAWDTVGPEGQGKTTG